MQPNTSSHDPNGGSRAQDSQGPWDAVVDEEGYWEGVEPLPWDDLPDNGFPDVPFSLDSAADIALDMDDLYTLDK